MFNLIEEQGIDIDTNKIGNPIIGNLKHKAIKKIDVNYNNVGKKRGIRIIVLVIVINNQAIILHAYNKSKKKDMTREEYRNLKIIFDSYKLETEK